MNTQRLIQHAPVVWLENKPGWSEKEKKFEWAKMVG
jgi:hypothetical protein